MSVDLPAPLSPTMAVDEPPMITVPITVEGVLMVIDRLPEDEQAAWLSRRTA